MKYVGVDYMMLEYKMQQILKHVNYVEVEVGVVVVIGLHKDIMRNNRVHAPTHVPLEVVWEEQPAIHLVVTVLPHRVHVHGIARLAVPYQDPRVIHKVVMERQQLVPIHVHQVVHWVVRHVLVQKERPLITHVLLVVRCQGLLVLFLHQERRNMDVPMVGQTKEVYVSCPLDNVYLRDV